MTRLVGTIVICAVLAGANQSKCFGAILTYNFQGTVNFVASPLDGTFSNGQTFSGSFTYDTTLFGGLDNTYGQFAPIKISLQFSGFGVTTDNGQIQLVHNEFNDSLTAFLNPFPAGTQQVNGLTLYSGGIWLRDYDKTWLSTANTLPSSLPALTVFEDAGVYLDFVEFGNNQSEHFQVRGTLTSLSSATPTPEPATLALWGSFSALGLAMAYRRRKREG